MGRGEGQGKGLATCAPPSSAGFSCGGAASGRTPFFFLMLCFITLDCSGQWQGRHVTCARKNTHTQTPWLLYLR